MSIAKNVEKFSDLLKEYKHCKLVAVSKTKSEQEIMEAYHAGLRIFGENKVQELSAKYEKLPGDIQWHMIGHLQRNKVKYIAPFVSLIHSVDSFKLLREIDKQAARYNRTVDCLLQVHIAEEETKFGLSEEELDDMLAADQAGALDHIRVKGLMGMATFTENEEQVRREFSALKKLFDKLKDRNLPNVAMEELSMGMSGDYLIALEEGSTMIRVGSAIFGQRNYN